MSRGRADFVAGESADVLRAAVDRLAEGFESLPPTRAAIPGGAEIARLLEEVADRLRDNYPYFHPLYAGQMLKPPHPARAPRLRARDVDQPEQPRARRRARELRGWRRRPSREIARDVRVGGGHLGHLCGGGTMANLEALWVAGQLRPGAAVVASSQAHYTHGRIGAVLGLPFEAVACDRARTHGRGSARPGGSSAAAWEPSSRRSARRRRARSIRCGRILALRDRFGFRLHADAAYGGYFGLADNLAPEARAAFDRLGEADSIVIDPHKHGLQPYGCGCVLFRDPSVGRFYKHDSPYTYFSSEELHLGEISLECSRPGASAVALWATQRLLPLEKGGEFAAGLADCRAAALALHAALAADPRFVPAFAPELDIVVWIPRAASVTEAGRRARRIFEEAARRDLHLALAQLPADFFDLAAVGIARDAETVTCLRSVLMKPEHREWLPRILELLSAATEAVAAPPAV